MKYLIIILIMTSTYCFAEYEGMKVVISNGLKARSNPSLESNVITTIRPGVRLQVISPSDSNWVEVKDKTKTILEGASFWVANEFINDPLNMTLHQPKEESYVITTSIAKWDIYRISPDGTFTFATPERIDGNIYGCKKGQTLISDKALYPPYCTYKGKLVNGTNDIVIGICPDEVDFCNIAFVRNKNGSYCVLGDANTYHGEYKSSDGFYAPSVCSSKSDFEYIKDDVKFIL